MRRPSPLALPAGPPRMRRCRERCRARGAVLLLPRHMRLLLARGSCWPPGHRQRLPCTPSLPPSPPSGRRCLRPAASPPQVPGPRVLPGQVVPGQRRVGGGHHGLLPAHRWAAGWGPGRQQVLSGSELRRRTARTRLVPPWHSTLHHPPASCTAPPGILLQAPTPSSTASRPKCQTWPARCASAWAARLRCKSCRRCCRGC